MSDNRSLVDRWNEAKRDVKLQAIHTEESLRIFKKKDLARAKALRDLRSKIRALRTLQHNLYCIEELELLMRDTCRPLYNADCGIKTFDDKWMRYEDLEGSPRDLDEERFRRFPEYHEDRRREEELKQRAGPQAAEPQAAEPQAAEPQAAEPPPPPSV